MITIRKIRRIIEFDNNGNIALAAFVICAISGIVLAVPYDVLNAYDSIALMLITNPAAVFFRNLHYWSAQFFLIFTLLHLWDHLKLGTSREQSKGVWFRLVLAILFTFMVMLTGFILKADADSLQARRILEKLISDIPLLGKFFVGLIFGSFEDLQLIYVHHIATATIFLIYIIFEHVKTIWTKFPTFLILLALLTLISFFIQSPLHNNIDSVIKGPWYFIGLQEILHWMSRPAWIWLLVLALLSLIFFTRNLNTNWQLYSRKIIGFFGIIYLLLTIIGFYFRGENWEWVTPWENDQQEAYIPLEFEIHIGTANFNALTANDIPVVLGKREACMICHKDVTGFAVSHNPEAIGCTSCHLGDPFSLNKNKAHKNMVLIPGNLEFANQTCGTINCHPGIPDRINVSLMTTNSGIVSVDRWVFNETNSPDKLAHIHELGHSAADQHLRNLCAKCHLGNPKIESGPNDELSRGGGCTACHLSYSKEGKRQHMAYIQGNKQEDLLPQIHPSLDIQISNDHCFGCHSRSGRISTNYEGWHETLLEEVDVIRKKEYRVLQDKRVFEYVSEDVHHKAEMDCIDCHNSYETMGDGTVYLHEEQAVKIRCEDCHIAEKLKLASYDELDSESKKIFDLRKFNHGDKQMIRGKESALALLNTYLKNDSAFMVGKNNGKIYLMNPPSAICTHKAHESLTCSACHSAWAPQCIGCHNEFDKNADGYDLLANRPITGTWVEYVGKFLAEPPTLGVWEGEQKQISPAIPGMALTIDKSGFTGKDEKMIFHRLFAPAAPHTSSVKGRNCKSCHNDPLAIGYGRGDLEYKTENGKGIWAFTPTYAANKYDGLPEDAWIKFDLKSENPGISTRTNFRAFNHEEQKRILRVGACLVCHEENSDIMIKSLNLNFEEYLKDISKQCILPD
ncbi:MAG: cytochrome b N-terminal domain-containing protein [Bacteroidetes bacterium]|nr:cytochrome b N-terminal domain-containing protein [Bacteroidota bacterium]